MFLKIHIISPIHRSLSCFFFFFFVVHSIYFLNFQNIGCGKFDAIDDFHPLKRDWMFYLWESCVISDKYTIFIMMSFSQSLDCHFAYESINKCIAHWKFIRSIWKIENEIRMTGRKIGNMHCHESHKLWLSPL